MIINYEHNYLTNFIIDSSSNFEQLSLVDFSEYSRIFIIVDSNVSSLYLNKMLSIIDRREKEVFIHEVIPVEESKSIRYYPTLINFFEQNMAGRYDAVIAIGGGIIIDLVSFTVSTYMRGLPLFIIATTLIGQTDASTAGKTCLNSETTKNLLGTFYYPKVVYNNIEILRTCSERITRQGLSEAFKYSLLTDGELISDIIQFQNTEFDSKIMEKIVNKTIESRVQIRKVDPLASNLGHTFGHALEKYFDYKILHGDAILIGTVMAINYAVKKGLMSLQECEKIFRLMKKAKLNIYISRDLDIERLVLFMRKDKKSSVDKLHLVEIEGIGKPYRGKTPFFEAEYEDIKVFLNNFMGNYRYKTVDLPIFLQKEVLYDE